MARELQDGQIAARFLSENSKFSAAFDEVFKTEGVGVIHMPFPEAGSERIRGALGGRGAARVFGPSGDLRPAVAITALAPGRLQSSR